MRLLVTGANGFVGRALCAEAVARGIETHGAVRATDHMDVLPATVMPHFVGDLASGADWAPALQAIDVIIHCAARVHVTKDLVADPLSAYRRVNATAVSELARQAADAGVRRLVLVSTIKVNGEATPQDRPFRPGDPPQPETPYAIAKWEGEQELVRVADNTGLQTVIVRAPLIYGPGVKANFFTLMNWLDKGLPLPFARIQNARSLLYLGNCVDVLLRLARHEAAPGHTFLVSDGVDLSTPELIRRLAAALGRRARLWPMPTKVLRSVAGIVGKAPAIDRLAGSLTVDDGHLRETIDWAPPYSIEGGLAATARWWQARTPVSS